MSSARRRRVSPRPARLMKNRSIRKPDVGPFGLTRREASMRPMVSALVVKSPAGGAVETVVTVCTQRRFGRGRGLRLPHAVERVIGIRRVDLIAVVLAAADEEDRHRGLLATASSTLPSNSRSSPAGRPGCERPPRPMPPGRPPATTCPTRGFPLPLPSELNGLVERRRGRPTAVRRRQNALAHAASPGRARRARSWPCAGRPTRVCVPSASAARPAMY